jgi:hypothetical protein
MIKKSNSSKTWNERKDDCGFYCSSGQESGLRNKYELSSFGLSSRTEPKIPKYKWLEKRKSRKIQKIVRKEVVELLMQS